jgi:hypothetical protein
MRSWNLRWVSGGLLVGFIGALSNTGSSAIQERLCKRVSKTRLTCSGGLRILMISANCLATGRGRSTHDEVEESLQRGIELLLKTQRTGVLGFNMLRLAI